MLGRCQATRPPQVAWDNTCQGEFDSCSTHLASLPRGLHLPVHHPVAVSVTCKNSGSLCGYRVTVVSTDTQASKEPCFQASVTGQEKYALWPNGIRRVERHKIWPRMINQ